MEDAAWTLAARARAAANDDDWGVAAEYLNGAIGKFLRTEVNVLDRRKAGIYFTGHHMGAMVAKALGPLTADDVVLDPTCGAGDLLLRCAERLPLSSSLEDTLSLWSKCLTGSDIEFSFTRLARDRLLVLAAHRHGVPIPHTSPRDFDFPKILAGDYKDHTDLAAAATAIAGNPPFSLVRLEEPRSWSSGSVNQAAVVIDDVLSIASKGTKIAIIVPEVLRSGSRYMKWRARIGSLMETFKFESLGRFDSWTDVDVALLAGTVGTPKTSHLNQDALSGHCLGSKFSVSVGPLVDFRDPHKGPWRTTIRSRNITNSTTGKKRRFQGRTEIPPFLAISRTSSPSDSPRIKGKVIQGNERMVVENHVLVIRHPKNDEKELLNLLDYLVSDQVTQWLNGHLRLRHLTVTAIRRIPLEERAHG